MKRDNAAYANNNKCDRVEINNIDADENNNNDVDENNNVSDEVSVSTFKYSDYSTEYNSNDYDSNYVDAENVPTNESLVVNIKRTTDSHRYCFVCKIEDKNTENSFRTICRDGISTFI